MKTWTASYREKGSGRLLITVDHFQASEKFAPMLGLIISGSRIRAMRNAGDRDLLIQFRGWLSAKSAGEEGDNMPPVEVYLKAEDLGEKVEF